jgi:N-acetylmuramoyl-L-alanine amidase
MGMKIIDNTLHYDWNGKPVDFEPSPNFYNMDMKPELVVLHYTAGGFQASKEWLKNPSARVSAHIIVGPDGRIVQLVPFNRPAWHAGKSLWNGRDNVNTWSIGIEITNLGKLRLDDDGLLKTWDNRTVPVSRAAKMTHRLEDQPAWWDAYTEMELAVTEELCKTICSHYEIKEIVGHDDIAPERKRDPGPAFPMDRVRRFALGS